MKRLFLEAMFVSSFAATTAFAQQSASSAPHLPSTTHAPLAAQGWPPRNDADLRKGFSIPRGKPILFRDAHGGRISEESFLAALPASSGFSFNGNDAIVVQMTLHVPGQPLPKPQPLRLNRGDLLPVLAGSTIDGKPFGTQNFLGRTTLVNFVYAGCTYCIEEVPVLNQFALENPSIQTVAITYDDPVLMREFVTKWHFNWPVVAGEVDYVDKLGLWVYPSLALVDTKGRLVGYIPSGDIHKNHELTASDIKAWVARVSASDESKKLPNRVSSTSH